MELFTEIYAMTKFPYSDVHSFKDYVGFVAMCAPDQFPFREGVGVEDQWSLELAFQGLREGLARAVEEKGNRAEFGECLKLIEEAYAHYKLGHEDKGFFTLDKAQKVLKRIRTS
jgi:hypothetical protein